MFDSFKSWLGLKLLWFCGLVILGLSAVYTQAKEGIDQDKLPLANFELTVGVSMQPPFSFVTDSLTDVQGVDIDIIKELQRRTGFKLKNGNVNFMHFGEMMELGQKGKLDIVAGGVVQSEGRKAFFDFAEPTIKTPFVLVARDDSDIHQVSDMRNHTLASEKGTVSADYIPNADSLNIKMQENLSIFMCLYAVHSKHADALVMDFPMARFYINNWEDSHVHIVANVSEPKKMGLLFRKNAEFTPYLQATFHEMVEDGTVERILEKYRGISMASKEE